MSNSQLSLFKAIAENLSQGMYVLQRDKAIFLNTTFANIFGFQSVDRLLNQNMFLDIYPDADSVDLFKSMHQQILEDSIPQVSWAQLSARNDGSPFWLEVEAQKIQVNGEPAILATFVDQTDCQFMAETMVVSQQTLRRLLDAMEDRVYVVSAEHKILYANRKMMETSLGDPEVEKCYTVCRGLKQPCESCLIDQVLEEGVPCHKEFFSEKNSTWYSSIEIPVRMPGVDGLAKLSVARDITSRKKSEEKVRALSHRLITAQEDERATLSRELHDDLGQRLNAATIVATTLTQDLGDITAEQQNHINSLTEILQGSIQSVRRLSSGLRPTSLERLGLVDTLKTQCEKMASLYKLQVDFKSAGFNDLTLDKKTEINLFRVAQEALNNIAKHAKASAVTVRLIASHPTLRLRISDDGIGFDKKKVQSSMEIQSQLGLLGMEERVDLLDGSIEIKSTPGNGTTIVTDVPYK